MKPTSRIAASLAAIAAPALALALVLAFALASCGGRAPSPSAAASFGDPALQDPTMITVNEDASVMDGKDAASAEPPVAALVPSSDAALLVVIPPEGASGAGADEKRGLEQLKASAPGAPESVRAIVGVADWGARAIAAAKDPKVRALLLCPAPDGAVDLFTAVRAARKDILLLAVQTEESPLLVQSVADLVMDPDFSSRAVTLAANAKTMGAKGIAFLKRSKPGEQEARLFDALQKAAAAEGLPYFSQALPSAKSKDAAKKEVAAAVSLMAAQAGGQLAFFCAEDSLQGALISECLHRGQIYLEGFRPSPFIGFPEALGMPLPTAGSPASQFPAFLRKVEEEVLRKKGAGKASTWAYGFSYTAITGLGTLALGYARGTGPGFDMKSVKAAMEKASPGVPWAIERYVDSVSGVRSKVHFLSYQDSYVFGRGYLGTVKSEGGSN